MKRLPLYHEGRLESKRLTREDLKDLKEEENEIIHGACRRWHMPKAAEEILMKYAQVRSGSIVTLVENNEQLQRLIDSTFLQVTADGIYMNWELLYELHDRNFLGKTVPE